MEIFCDLKGYGLQSLPKIFVSTFGSFLLFYLAWALFHKRTGFPLPPSPHGIPLLGNIFDVPDMHGGRYFKKLHQQLKSPIVRLSVLGTHMIDISDPDLARELLEKRSKINSARPFSLYFSKYFDPEQRLWGFQSNVRLSYKVGSQLAHQAMATVKQGRTENLQLMQSRVTLKNLLGMNEGGNFMNWRLEIQRFAASMLTCSIYGFDCTTMEEPRLLKLLYILVEQVRAATTTSIIDTIPILDYIPGPMPWRVASKSYLKEENQFYQSLIHEALHGEGAKLDTWCRQFAFSKINQEDLNKVAMEQDSHPQFVAQLLTAGYDTTTHTTCTFVLAYLLHPKAFVSAIEQIDTMVGNTRMPDFSDRESLIMVEAVIRELLRWRPPTPQGVPHSSIEDQVVEVQDYEGNPKSYFIPKGSALFVNQWAIDSDEKNWQDAKKFIPERWIDENGQLRDWQNSPGRPFGYGRRNCPGRPFAERSLYIMISGLLWGFEIEKVDDPKTGETYPYDDMDFLGEFSDGPKPFPCKLVPRSEHHKQVILKTWENQDKDLNSLLGFQKSE